jgi:hypothetical protein
MTATALQTPVRRGPPAWMLALGGFMIVVVAVNAAFVWLSSRGHRDLVRRDYYAAGLKQDSLIALTAMAGPVSLRREGGDWRLEAAVPAATGCRLRFYRPDDGSADREIRLERAPGSGEIWRGRSPDLRRGHWIATAIWERDGADWREASIQVIEP